MNTMRRLVRSWNAEHKNRALSTAFVLTALLVLPGCGIPPLRSALPGASLPHSFFPLPSSQNVPAGSKNQAVDAAVVPVDAAVVPVNYIAEPNGNENEPTPSVDGAAPADSGAMNSEALPPSAASGAPAAEELPPSVNSEPTSFQNPSDHCENSAQLGFHQFFDDPYLVGLIEQALAGNQELRILNEEIQIASNEVRARRGEYLPFLSFGTRAGLEKPSLYTPAGAVEDQLQVIPGKGFPEPLPNFLVAADISWEIDIWRRLRNARDAASLRYLGTANGRNYMITRMVAEIAEDYYELLALDSRLQTLDKTIQIQETSLDLAKQMMAAGRGSSLAVQRFQAEVRKNQSEWLIIQQRIVEVENEINFTLGRFPQRVERSSVNYIDLQLHALRVGVPSQLLRNREDVREAERQLAAAGLDVQVARARFYPALILSAGAGYEAFNTRYLFYSPESLIYNVAGNLVGPLINKAAIRADYLTANAKQLQAVYNYQRTVLNAYTEVVNRLSKVENYGQSIETKRQQVASLEASVDSATRLFQTARGEYLDVLLSQRDMMEAKMVLIETKQQQLSAIVNAYQALGGGGPTAGIQYFGPSAPTGEIILEQPPELKPEEDLPPAAQLQRLPRLESLPPVTELPLQNPVDSRNEEDKISRATPPANLIIDRGCEELLAHNQHGNLRLPDQLIADAAS
jgi:NodT family efflux transporter outer membrane factor (OMF) lipoprotein